VRIGPPVCGSDHQCVDSAHLTHSPGRDPLVLSFHPRAMKSDGKSAITTSRFPCLEDGDRPACRWARELPFANLLHDRSKPSRLAMGRWVEAMAAAPRAIDRTVEVFMAFRPMIGHAGSSPLGRSLPCGKAAAPTTIGEARASPPTQRSSVNSNGATDWERQS
jgi:hypothetical protein